MGDHEARTRVTCPVLAGPVGQRHPPQATLTRDQQRAAGLVGPDRATLPGRRARPEARRWPPLAAPAAADGDRDQLDVDGQAQVGEVAAVGPDVHQRCRVAGEIGPDRLLSQDLAGGRVDHDDVALPARWAGIVVGPGRLPGGQASAVDGLVAGRTATTRGRVEAGAGVRSVRAMSLSSAPVTGLPARRRAT
jgi:hypothetical protein